MDIVVWLRSLGLGKYEAAFRENEIDETVLPSLTHEILKELGVTAIGHRRSGFALTILWRHSAFSRRRTEAIAAQADNTVLLWPERPRIRVSVEEQTSPVTSVRP